MLGYAIQQLCRTVETNSRRYVVMTAAACMPSSCWGTYGKVAVVKTDGVTMPKIIHPNHKAVKRIVRTWDRQFCGTSDRCAFAQAKRHAEELAERLNRQWWNYRQETPGR